MELPKKTSSMNKIPFYFYALIICSMGLFAAYDPTTGTGGGGDVFTASNNTFRAINVFETNVWVQRLGPVTGGPALTVGTNYAFNDSDYIAVGVDSSGNESAFQLMGPASARWFEINKSGQLYIIDGGGIGGGSSGSYLDSDELTFVKNGGNILIQNLTASANSTATLAGGTGPGGNSILRASGVTALTATSNNVSTALNFGIGTNFSSARLHIEGGTGASTNNPLFIINGGVDRNADFIRVLGSASITNIFTVSNVGNTTNGGNFTVGGNINTVSGSYAVGSTVVITGGRLVRSDVGNTGSPAFSFSTDTDTGFYRVGANSIGVSVGTIGSSVWDAGANFGVTSNITSRGFGAAVSAISTTTNSLLQVFSGTYSGAPATVTFGTVYAAAPTVVVTTTENGGSALQNDTVFVTNITTSTCVIGYRASGGSSSGATITFNGIALGRQ